MRIHHIAIWTKDLEKMAAFYEKYFGAVKGEKYINARSGYQSYFLKFENETYLELMQMDSIPENLNNPDKQYQGIIHLAFSTGSKEEVDRKTSCLNNDGYIIISEPRTTGDGYYESCVYDPEKNRIEITI